MPAKFDMTWLTAFSQCPYFQPIEEREALETENLSWLQKLPIVQRNLERDITTNTTEWNTANNVVYNNKQKSKDYKFQMQKYGALIAAPTAKTTPEYTKYSEGIQRYSRILVGYKRGHISDRQTSNVVYDRQTQQETALVASKEATCTSKLGYDNCKQVIWTKERMYRRAVKNRYSKTGGRSLREIDSLY